SSPSLNSRFFPSTMPFDRETRFAIGAWVCLLLAWIPAFFFNLLSFEITGTLFQILLVPMGMLTEKFRDASELLTTMHVQFVTMSITLVGSFMMEHLMTTQVVSQAPGELWTPLFLGKFTNASAAMLFMFPVYFTIVRAAATRPALRRSCRSAVRTSSSCLLPCSQARQ
ncbi:hypothetical protein PFISCL1PPCAC_21926, partial [Pristionchus fissidentatus]